MTATREQVRSASESCLLVDRSISARLLATGPDILALLQRLGTGDVASLHPGDAGRTVLTTNKGRIVQHLFVNPLGDAGVLLIGGSGSAAEIGDHLARYTFAEKIDLVDVSERIFQLTLTGPRAGEILGYLGVPVPAAGRSVACYIEEESVRVLGHDGWTTDGFSVIGEAGEKEKVLALARSGVESGGGTAGSESSLEVHRILRGIPAAGHELTLEYNPLEAGLWDAVSFDKGCYVGQEVVARLRTYDKVSRSIVGLELGDPAKVPEIGAALTVDGRPVGALTSAVRVPGGDRAVGLGYVKRKQMRPELVVGIEGSDVEAGVVELPLAL